MNGYEAHGLGPARRILPGRGCLIAGLLLAGILISVTLLLGPARWSGGGWEEILVEGEGRTTNKVALVHVEGIISGLLVGSGGDTMSRSIRKQLSLAAGDPSVRGVLMVVDSPGGEVIASDDIHREILQFQIDSGKPVVASLSGLAASGGYYVASACRWIVANELTLTGSIGVILHSYNYRRLMDKVGVEPVVFKSGRFKDMLSGAGRPGLSDEVRQMVQDMVDEAFVRFKEAVREGRRAALAASGGGGRPLAGDWEEYADGRILTGIQAHRHGFVDELGGLDRAGERMAGLLGLGSRKDYDLIRYRSPATLSSLLGLSGRSPEPRIELDLGVDLPRIEAGRLYYLSPHLPE